jgi:hypothetical protein
MQTPQAATSEALDADAVRVSEPDARAPPPSRDHPTPPAVTSQVQAVTRREKKNKCKNGAGSVGGGGGRMSPLEKQRHSLIGFVTKSRRQSSWKIMAQQALQEERQLELVKAGDISCFNVWCVADVGGV